MLRHSPGPSGGRQSRTKWPALASSAARTASAARNSSTLTGLVPSGTVVTRSVRYSMGFSFRSRGFSRLCHRLLRDLCDIHASPTRPHWEARVCDHLTVFPLRYCSTVLRMNVLLGISVRFAASEICNVVPTFLVLSR